ncbi:MAG: thiamine ABC transporter substrate-binding protein [Caldilineaceae bacterium]|nr:thiamine ABC transporter substrate-binding protein [Caldilineaceae bacterium]
MNRSQLAGILTLLALILTACQPVSAPSAAEGNVEGDIGAPTTLIVAAHDSFSVSEDVVTEFETANNATVQFLTLGDAGEALNKMILSKQTPLADVFFGVDNTFLSRALDADLFAPYAAPALAVIPDVLKLDPQQRLLPVDYGFITLNADKAWFSQRGLALPATLDDLTAPEYKGLLVVENPATSSPGLAFLLATIDYFGEDGYLSFWEALRANDVLVADGWSAAYYDHFTVGSGGSGDRPLAVSYTTSPPADVLYASDGRTEPAGINVNLPGGAFRQIEFAGIVDGTEKRELAERWVDFMLSKRFQEDLPLQMFVYPALPDAELPDLFVQFAEQIDDPAEVEPAAIEANRETWIAAWTETMLR